MTARRFLDLAGAGSISCPSLRRYHVRPARPGDHPACREEAVDWRQCVTITRLTDLRRWIFARLDYFYGPPRDADDYAEQRLLHAAIGGAK
jgi:hypothetical protein